MTDEDRYEHIDILVKAPAEGDSWFDRIFDLISEKCDSVQIDPDDEDSDWTPCSCGMESMGGSSGTLDQCYEHMRISEKWAFDVEANDLKLILKVVDEKRDRLMTGREWEAYDRLRAAAYWHDNFQDWIDNLPDEEDEDGSAEGEL